MAEAGIQINEANLVVPNKKMSLYGQFRPKDLQACAPVSAIYKTLPQRNQSNCVRLIKKIELNSIFLVFRRDSMHV
jgi:hypothetical protein